MTPDLDDTADHAPSGPTAPRRAALDPTAPDLAAPDLQAWIGRSEAAAFTLDPWPANALAAALGADDAFKAGDALPPFWHHLYGLPVVHAARTGPDGHEARGGFLPPVKAPHRMWAGGRLTFDAHLRLGERVTRTSTVRSIQAKHGRTGPLTFVTVEHRLLGESGGRVTEEQDLVYRETITPAGTSPGTPAAPSADASPPPPEPATWQRTWHIDEILLFRYSALTYNAHRIHYDKAYAATEGYPGLVVHGPLLATLMLELVRRELPGRMVRRFSFRALAPVFCGSKATIFGRPENSGARLFVVDEPGQLAMTGDVAL